MAGSTGSVSSRILGALAMTVVVIVAFFPKGGLSDDGVYKGKVEVLTADSRTIGGIRDVADITELRIEKDTVTVTATRSAPGYARQPRATRAGPRRRAGRDQLSEPHADRLSGSRPDDKIR